MKSGVATCCAKIRFGYSNEYSLTLPGRELPGTSLAFSY